MPGPFLTVLIPCFNEEEGLQRVEEETYPVLAELGRPCEVLAVDDGSTDGTAAALDALAARRADTRVLKHSANRGLGAAIRTGIEGARGTWLVPLDADLTFHPGNIAELLRARKETAADCVTGSPYLGGMPGVPLARRLPSLMMNAFYRGLFGRKLTSYTPMFRLYKTEDLRELPLTSEGFEISVEILVRLLRAGRTVVEVPVPLTVRRTGVSKLSRFRELSNHLSLAARLAFGS